MKKFKNFSPSLSRKMLIFISLTISYLISYLLNSFLDSPYPKISMIKESINNFKKEIAKVKLPNISSLFSPNLSSIINTNYNINKIIGKKNISPSGFEYDKNLLTPTLSSNLTITKTQPSSTPTIFNNYFTSPYPTGISTPKPTKTPKPTPTPTFTLTNPRPGKNIIEVAQIVSKVICTPAAMIYAIYDNEAGHLGQMVNSNWTYYNTYQGSDPTDIPGSQALFGVTQMMGDTWHRIKPYVAQKLGSNEISLNVTFDSMAAAAYHVGNISLAWKNHISCEDWPVDYILYGACRYNGACPPNTFGQKQYYNSYTYSVCESYNEYLMEIGANRQKNCNK